MELIAKQDEEVFFNMSGSEQLNYLHNRFDNMDANTLDQQEFDDYCWCYATMMTLEYIGRSVPVRINTSFRAAGATNGSCIEYNPENSLFTSSTSNAEKLEAFQGTICHEILHVLYTDFENDNLWLDALDNMAFAEPELQYAMTAMRSDSKLYQRTTKFFENLHNTLEDARIERKATEHMDAWFLSRLMVARNHEIDAAKNLTRPVSATVILMASLACVDLFGRKVTDSMLCRGANDIGTKSMQVYRKNKPLFERYIDTDDGTERNHIMTELFASLFPVLLKDHESSATPSSSCS